MSRILQIEQHSDNNVKNRHIKDETNTLDEIALKSD